MNNQYKTVAKAVRVEKDSKDNLYLVFEIIDEDLKKRIINDWTSDIELILKEK